MKTLAKYIIVLLLLIVVLCIAVFVAASKLNLFDFPKIDGNTVIFDLSGNGLYLYTFGSIIVCFILSIVIGVVATAIVKVFIRMIMHIKNLINKN